MKRICPIAILAVAIGCGKGPPRGPAIDTATTTDVIPAEIPPEPKNIVFPNAPFHPSAIPTVTWLSPTWPDGTAAVWGSLGRDHRGHIYVGVSCEPANGASAHLLEFDPTANQWHDRGGAVEQLRRLNLAKPGESQNKIHTKIWQAPDGYLYFASMDETGELDDGTALPVYGSHLWRVKPGGSEWEHLKAVPEGVVAAAAGGSSVYFLGYFGHVVYRIDTKTGAITSTRVGATGGHISRNIVAKPNGRVSIPRLRSGEASLVELNAELDEILSFPLENYSLTPNAESHGIVSFAGMRDGSQFFCTDQGRLYAPMSDGLNDCGFIHPQGNVYVSSLMSPDGERWLCGIGHRPTRGEPQYEWIVYDLKEKKSTAAPIALPLPVANATSVLIYGSITRDDAGRWYVGGAFKISGRRNFTPALWRIEFGAVRP